MEQEISLGGGGGRETLRGWGSGMIRRQCPECGRVWCSEDTEPWPCGYCGTMLDDRHNRPLELEKGGWR